MMYGIHIAAAREKDLSALRELYLETRQSAFFWLDKTAMKLEDFDRDTKGEYIFCAYIGKDLAGFLSCWEEDRFVHCLYVHPKFQRKGVGRRLLSQAASYFGTPLTLKCLKKNIPALQFYQSLGWKIENSGESEEGDWYRLKFNISFPT